MVSSFNLTPLILVTSALAAPGIPAAVSALLTSSLETLIPAELSLETFNNVFIQQHSSSAPAIFAAARVSRLLGTSSDVVENLIFGVLAPDVRSDVQVGYLCIVNAAS